MTLATIERIQQCAPPPAEILVHVDGGQTGVADQLRERFPDLRVLVSETSVGPGGGRNKLVQAAQQQLVASFDDDSYPADPDYFQRVVAAAAADPDAAIFAATILDGMVSSIAGAQQPSRVASFVGCGCVCRREVFLPTGGYVPVPVAYGLEEVDLSLRLHAQGHRIMHDPSLRVVHELNLGNRASAKVSAAMVANLALLVYLRYPAVLWPLGLAQCLKTAGMLLCAGHWRGVMQGLTGIPRHLHHYREYRARLTMAEIIAYHRLRHSMAAS